MAQGQASAEEAGRFQSLLVAWVERGEAAAAELAPAARLALAQQLLGARRPALPGPSSSWPAGALRSPRGGRSRPSSPAHCGPPEAGGQGPRRRDQLARGAAERRLRRPARALPLATGPQSGAGAQEAYAGLLGVVDRGQQPQVWWSLAVELAETYLQLREVQRARELLAGLRQLDPEPGGAETKARLLELTHDLSTSRFRGRN